HGADLDGVAGEVGGERPAGGVDLGGCDRPGGQARLDPRLPLPRAGDGGVGAVRCGPVAVPEVEHVGVEATDLRPVQLVHVAAGGATAAALQGDERVAGDLVGEPGAPLAQDAAVPVQHDLRGDLQRLREGP